MGVAITHMQRESASQTRGMGKLTWMLLGCLTVSTADGDPLRKLCSFSTKLCAVL